MMACGSTGPEGDGDTGYQRKKKPDERRFSSVHFSIRWGYWISEEEEARREKV
jgi:hypothetical protein